MNKVRIPLGAVIVSDWTKLEYDGLEEDGTPILAFHGFDRTSQLFFFDEQARKREVRFDKEGAYYLE